MVTGSMPAEQIHQRLPYRLGVVGKPFTADQLHASVRQVVGDA